MFRLKGKKVAILHTDFIGARGWELASYSRDVKNLNMTCLRYWNSVVVTYSTPAPPAGRERRSVSTYERED